MGILPGEAPAATSVGVGGVQAATEVAMAALAGAFATASVSGSRAEWAAAVGSLQQVIDVATAVQDAAIVRLAAIEPEYLEDGTEVETHRALGHVALDAPAILSGVLSVSALHAERRVEAAVLLAADGPEGSDTDSGLGGLHAAMGQGRLDSYRAGVLAEELAAAPPQVRETVVTLLRGALRGRGRCAPAAAVSSGVGADQPGAVAGAGQAGQGAVWVAAVGGRAWGGPVGGDLPLRGRGDRVGGDRRPGAPLRQGRRVHAHRGRPREGTDRPGGRAGDHRHRPDLHRPGRRASCREADGHRDAGTAGSEVVAEGPGSDDLVEVIGPAGNQPVFVSRNWVKALAGARAGNDGRPPRAGTVEVAPCHPDTGALVDPASRFPQETRVEQETSLPQDQAIKQDSTDGDPRESGAEAPDEAVQPTRTGIGADTPNQAVQPTRSDALPIIGASTLQRIAAGFGAGAYRPSGRMAKRVKARDRRCRFPGCTVAAVFCDLDHVRPWPTGPTADTNLICLCRRHHRVKQRPGWRVTLAADGTLTWTDPTGRVRTTAPADALTCTVLGGAATPPPAPVSTSITRTDLPDGPHSDLEFRLEHLRAAARPTSGGWSIHGHPMATSWRDDNGTRHSAELTPTTNVIVFEVTSTPCRRPRHGGRHTFPDHPPF